MTTWLTHRRGLEKGVSLIELLVAMVIGAVLIFGATQVYVDSRNTYAVNETSARLQETARYALSVLEPDIRMANYWGLLKGYQWVVDGRADQFSARSAVADQDDVNKCGTNFAVDLQNSIQADNNTYSLSLSGSRSADCDPFNGRAVTSADTLIIRRAAVATAAPALNTIQLCSTRANAYLFSDGSTCIAAPDGQVNDLVVNAYYVAQDSVGANGTPALRRWRLVSGPDFQTDEIIPGVEDMQVQFGIDTTGSAGASAQRYVNPGTVLPPNSQVVAVRMWLLVRSDTPEVGFIDNAVYEYGDRSTANGYTSNLSDPAAATRAYQPSRSADDTFASVKHYRRLLVSRTIQIRNALGT